MFPDTSLSSPLPGVLAVHPPVRVPGDPAHPGALHGRADGRRAGGAARAHGAAGAGPVRELRGAARARARLPGGEGQDHGHRAGEGALALAAQVRKVPTLLHTTTLW